MKIEFEVRAFGKVEVDGTEDAYNSTELMRVHNLPKDTTLAEMESILAALFNEAEGGYAHPEQCLGKITIRAKKDSGEVLYLG
ncbi:hypothetical protein [Paenibacillus tarimensis]|uniref:hypothetical protein n=1 Tax=Paenibacillus tarimensis TaxID=416012 RepID=UPI001F26FB67|nr:hypothetical protein [Paenibacillus tarimensis]MCF2944370.1 hypothetical protein [Paenibacillus tarimensis]